MNKAGLWARTMEIYGPRKWTPLGNSGIFARHPLIDAQTKFSHRFINNVSGSYQKEPPPSFQGGLLADEMGLGKTLTMISLIATNATYQDLSPPSIISRSLEKISCPPVKTTLLVVPPPRMFFYIMIIPGHQLMSIQSCKPGRNNF